MDILKFIRPRWRHSDPNVRLAAVNRLNNYLVLIELAKEDLDLGVRGLAFRRCAEIIGSDRNPKRQEEKINQILDALLDSETIKELNKYIQSVKLSFAQCLLLFAKEDLNGFVSSTLAFLNDVMFIRDNNYRYDSRGGQGLIDFLNRRQIKDKMRSELIESFALIVQEPYPQWMFKDNRPELPDNNKERFVADKINSAVLLTCFGGKASIPYLVSLLSDPKLYVRRKAVKLLDRLEWSPVSPDEQAYYLAAIEKWSELLNLGKVSIKALVNVIQHEDYGWGVNRHAIMTHL